MRQVLEPYFQINIRRFFPQFLHQAFSFLQTALDNPAAGRVVEYRCKVFLECGKAAPRIMGKLFYGKVALVVLIHEIFQIQVSAHGILRTFL